MAEKRQEVQENQIKQKQMGPEKISDHSGNASQEKTPAKERAGKAAAWVVCAAMILLVLWIAYGK